MFEVLLRGVSPEHQGAMEMWKQDVVPGDRSRGACFESWNVVFEVGDYHLHNLWGKLRGWGVFMGVSGCPCAAATLMSLALERRWRGARSLE